MRSFIITIGILASATIATIASAQEPYYSGVDSIGAKPIAQDPAPALFFEAKVHWPSLKLDAPRTAWEFAQRGMYRQDDLEDVAAAEADYREAIAMDGHLLIARARLGTILLKRAGTETSSAARVNLAAEAIDQFDEVLHEQPFRPGMHKKIAQAYVLQYQAQGDPARADMAVTAYRAELAQAPQNQSVHYELAFLLNGLGRGTEARTHIDRYLELAALHGDPYPYKILAAEQLRQGL